MIRSPCSLVRLALVLLLASISACCATANTRQGWRSHEAQGQRSLKDSRTSKRKSSYLGIQPAQYGVPAYGVRRHLVLGTSALPDGEFYEVNVVLPDPNKEEPLNISRPDLPGVPCHAYAASIQEPMSPLYERRNRPPRPLPGGINRAFFRWPGNVTRADFDAVPYSQRGPLCGHCTNFVSYKVLNGQLYRGPEPDAYSDMMAHRQRAEDMFLVTLYLFDIPDMDVKLHFGDGCPTDVAAFSWNVCRHKPRGGFTMPSTTAWGSALGPFQTRVYHNCLNHRYPPGDRRPVAFWRGTNTDNTLVDKFTGEDYRNCTRIRLHMDFKPTEKTRIDAQLSALIFADDKVRQAVLPVAPRLAMEDFNKAAVILDMDGNGWSDRWVKSVHYNTFMLKQASNNTAFFEHLMGPGPIGFFKNDLSDLQQVVNRTMDAWDTSPLRLQHRAKKMQAFASAMLNHVAVVEAFGHSLMVYHSKLTWKAEPNSTYKLIPFRLACTMGWASLPRPLCLNIHNHMQKEQPNNRV